MTNPVLIITGRHNNYWRTKRELVHSIILCGLGTMTESAKNVVAVDPEEYNKRCKEEEDSCNFFTFLKIRGNPVCNLLTECSAKTRCPSTQDWASGMDK